MFQLSNHGVPVEVSSRTWLQNFTALIRNYAKSCLCMSHSYRYSQQVTLMTCLDIPVDDRCPFIQHRDDNDNCKDGDMS